MKNVKLFFLFVAVFMFSGCRIGNPNNSTAIKKMSAIAEKQEVIRTDRKPVKILFVGDMMFDRYIREAVQKYGHGDYNYALQPIKQELSKYDLVVGNLEGPIINQSSTSVGTSMDEKKNLVFTFDPAVAKILVENNIKLLNIGNNHISNQGEEGITETKRYLDGAGAKYFGDAGQPDKEYIVEEMGGNKIAFLNYNYSVQGSFSRALEDIKEAKNKADFLIVLPHWGTEFKVGDPGANSHALGHKFVDAGADLVIGTHPHVVESIETFMGKKIYYSLGNFVFDQYFQKETAEGMGVEVTINPDLSLQYNELRFVMNRRGQTTMNKEQ